MKVTGVESPQKVNERLNKARLFLALRKEVAQKEAELKALKLKKDNLERELLEIYREDGSAGDKVDGYTMYVLSNVYVNVTDDKKQEFYDVLSEIGLDHLIKPNVNTMTLKAVVKELQDSADTGDIESQNKLKRIYEVANVFEKFTIGATAGKQSAASEKLMKNGT